MAKHAKRLIWTKWVWESWLSDPGLRLCDEGARGVWMDMLALMGLSAEYGVLLINGRVPTNAHLARFIGVPEQRLEKHLEELLSNGVPSKRSTDGALYCRRMLREEHERAGVRKRQKRSRKRNSIASDEASESHGDVTAMSRMSHGDVTAMSRHESRGEAEAETEAENRDRIPQTPKPGGGRQEPTNQIRMVDPTGVRIAAMLGRPAGRKWTAREVQAFQAALPIDQEELALVEHYYKAELPEGEKFRRRSLHTLLENWPGEVDAARAWRRGPGRTDREKWVI